MRKVVLLGVLTLGLILPASALAKGPEVAAVTGSDIVLNDDTSQLKEPGVANDATAFKATRRFKALAANTTPPLGTQKFWYSRNGNALVRDRLFTLRAVTGHSEIWVSNVLDFLAGDCRNDGDRNVITDAQVNYLANEFENNIYPKESAEFSVPPDRDGSHALRGQPGTPASGTGGDNYYGGDGNKIVILVDNVRDDNYNDLNNSQGLSYIAGFFSSNINTLLDRNVMTVDSYDWTHRTGANPPNEPVAGNLCTSKPARPFLYEGVFAHEYQHLLEFYESPGEATWANEGISDFAIALTGYVNPKTSIQQTGFDSHLQCFLGFLTVSTPANPNPRATGGPENSLTWWEDQGTDETLCDYGAAFSFMLWLSDHYGSGFMSALHREDANGLEGLQNVLDSFATGKTAQDVLHNWAVAVAADKSLDDGHDLRGTDFPALYQLTSMNAEINWGSEAYSEAGAPPNGSDYVSLRKADGTALSARELSSLSFKGATAFAPLPTEWTIDAQPAAPGRQRGLLRRAPGQHGQRDDPVDQRAGREPVARVRHPVEHRGRVRHGLRPGLDGQRPDVDSLSNADMTTRCPPAPTRSSSRTCPGSTASPPRGGTRRSPWRRTRGRPCSCRSGTSPT